LAVKATGRLGPMLVLTLVARWGRREWDFVTSKDKMIEIIGAFGMNIFF
jgi:hypothetical protein